MTPPTPAHILFIRADAIGDSVLASSMLPPLAARFPSARITVVCQNHVAPLYEKCPHVQAIVSFDLIKIYQDPVAREQLVRQIQSLGADLCLNSVYSRDRLGDFLALNSGAAQTIALSGDICNMTPQELETNNRKYTHLIPSPGRWKSELQRHCDFLGGLDITTQTLAPQVWTSGEDRQTASEIFKRHALNPELTIALFAATQYEIRSYAHFGKSLAALCHEYNVRVVALGNANDKTLNQACLNDVGLPTVNLCGQTTLRQTAEILRRCRLALGAETGLAQIACAVGTPHVVLLGGGHFGRFLPYSPLTSIVCLPLSCYACNWTCRHTVTHCVKDIAPELLDLALRDAYDHRSELPRIYLQDAAFAALPPATEWSVYPDLLPTQLFEFIRVIPSDTAPPAFSPPSIRGCPMRWVAVPRCQQSTPTFPSGVMDLDPAN